eukprot:1203379-Rhodomonas_salina.2
MNASQTDPSSGIPCTSFQMSLRTKPGLTAMLVICGIIAPHGSAHADERSRALCCWKRVCVCLGASMLRDCV